MPFDFQQINKKKALVYISLFIFLIVIVVVIIVYNKQKTTSTTPTQAGSTQPESVKSQKMLSNSVLFTTLSSDGTSIYYQNPDDGFFYKLNAASGKSEKIGRAMRGVSDVAWSPDKPRPFLA